MHECYNQQQRPAEARVTRDSSAYKDPLTNNSKLIDADSGLPIDG